MRRRGEIGVLLKPRPHHRVAAVAGEDRLGRFCAAAWAAAEHGLSRDEPAARAAFDLLRGILLDIDRMYEPYLLELAAMRTSLSWRLSAASFASPDDAVPIDRLRPRSVPAPVGVGA